jgi:N-methylhydantoinase A
VLLGVDVGGTFTDAVLIDGERIHSAKSPTTPHDQSEGVIAALRAVLGAAGAEPEAIGHFAHGMTVGTNALLERDGAATALVATHGFTDLLEIARQDRPSLYRLCADRPPPLSPPHLRVGVRERIGPAGTIAALEREEIDRVVAEVGRLAPESVAICLLFSYIDPSHELALAAAIRDAHPDLHVSTSAEVLPQFREYERCATTVLDAYLSPLLGRYLRRLGDECRGLGVPVPMVMQSSGGVLAAEEAAGGGAWSVLSGPAGGAVGAGLIAAASGDGNALGLDMGGTSCDVCVIEDGVVRRTDSREFDGRPIQLPMLDVHTVGAGGGSVAWADPGGALRVGPRSAGARPGPACYGNGGEEPTVTDANLLLGYLGAEGGLAGDIALDREAAERAVGRLAEELGLAPEEAARGIVAVANAEMVRALRVVTVERGVDPRSYALLPFGGAGPLHAAAIAEELGIDRLVCPRTGGVLSALGLIASERRRDTARTVMLAGGDVSRERIAAEVGDLAADLGAAGEDSETTLEATYELRYRGQAFELPVPGPLEPDPAELMAGFAAEHEARYGYRDADAAIELVNIRLAARSPVAEVRLPAATGDAERTSRRASFGGAWLEADVLRGLPGPGTHVDGPAVVELPETTLVLPPGWHAGVDETGTIVAERRTEGNP